MTAIIGGNSLGLNTSSLATLGQRGGFGQAATGRNGELAYVNAVTGNLVLQTRDELLVGRGLSIRSVRTYNSQGQFTDDNGDNWLNGLSRKVFGLTGTANAIGSTITRQDEDGALAVYTWNATTSRYESFDGAGAVDALAFNSSTNRWTWTDGDTGVVESYDGANGGRLDKITDPSGNSLSFTFLPSGLLASVADASGETTYYDYAGSQLTQVRSVKQDGSTTTRVRYTYDNNRLATVTVDLSPDNGSIADGKTYVTTYTYVDSSKRVSSIQQSDGTRLDITYVLVDGQYRVETVTDALGNKTQISYDTANRRTTVTDPLGLVSTYDYDAQGQLVRVTAPAVNGASQVSSFTYNTRGDVVRVVDAAGKAVEMAYDANGNQVLQRDSLGNTVTRTYDARNQLLTETVSTTGGLVNGGGVTIVDDSVTKTGGAEGVWDASFRSAQGYGNGAFVSWTVEQNNKALTVGLNTDPATDNYHASLDWAIFCRDDGRLIAFQNGQTTVDLGTYAAGDRLAVTYSGGAVRFVHNGQVAHTVNTTIAAPLFVDSTFNRLGARITNVRYGDAPFVDTAGTNVVGDTINKTTSAAAWDAGFRSTAGYVGGAIVSFDAERTDRPLMVGLNTDPSTDSGVDSLDWAIMLGWDGVLNAYEYGQKTAQLGVFAAGDRLSVSYDGAYVRFLQNGKVLRSVAASITKPLYADASLYHPYAKVMRLEFGPQQASPAVTEDGFVNTGGTNVVGDTVNKTTSAAAWDAGFRSKAGYVGGASVSFTAERTDRPLMVGLNTDPGTDSSCDSIDWGFMLGWDGVLQAYSNGVKIKDLGTFAAGDRLSVTYDGANVRFLKNGVVQHTAAATITQALYADASLYHPSAKVLGLQFNGLALAPADGLVGDSSVIVTGDTAVKTFPSNAWDASVRSTSAYAGGAYVSFTPTQRDKSYVIGLNSDPATDTALTSIDWGLMLRADGTLCAIENSITPAKELDSYAVGDQLAVVYDGKSIRYLRNGVAVWTHDVATTAPLFLDSSFFSSGAKVANLRFGSNAPTDLTTRYVYDAGGKNQLRFVITPEGRVTEYRYDGLGQRSAAIEYAAAGYDLRSWFAGAVPTELQMTSWATAQDKTATSRIDYAYDFRGQLKTSTAYAKVDANGNGLADGQSQTQFIYDAAGLLLKTILPTGGSTTYTYDGLGRVLTEMDSDGQVATTAYDDANNRTTFIARNSLVTMRTHDRAGRLVSVLQSSAYDGSLGETQFYYDADGRLRMTQDPTGVRTYALYDDAGRKVADIDANGSLVESVYNAANQRVRTIRYANAVNVAPLVDIYGKPAKVDLSTLRPGGAQVSAWTLYDRAGRVAKQIDEMGYVTETRYDGASRVTDVIRYANAISLGGITVATRHTDAAAMPAASADDRRTRYFYDADGRVLATLDGEGYLSENTYDAAGRLLKTVAYVTATATGLRPEGTLAQLRPAAVNGKDAITWRFYDGQDRIVATVDAEGYLNELTYDSNGHQTTDVRYATKAYVTPEAITATTPLASLRPAAHPKDRVTRAEYNTKNQLTKQTDAEGTVTTYVYDKVGNVASTTRAAGTEEARTRTASYDRLGRLVGELGGEGSAALAALGATPTQAQIDTVWASYGLRHAYDAAGRRISTTDANGYKTLFYYDVDGRLAFSVNALGEVQEHQYDTLGRETASIAYGTRIALAGLTGGLVNAAITNAVTTVKNSYVDSKTNYTYNARDQLEQTTDALNQVDNVRLYNAFGELAQLKQTQDASIVTTVAKVYDRRGLLKTSTQDAGGANLSTLFEYDAFGRATKSTDPFAKSTQTFYDRIGRVVQTRDALNVDRFTTYDAFSRVLTTKDGNGYLTDYTYDDVNRELTVKNPLNVSVVTKHDRHGSTVSVLDGKKAVTRYEYDKDGHLKKTVQDDGGLNITTRSNYDNAGRLIEAYDANNVKTTYEYDAANRVLKRTVDPDGLKLITSQTYDAKGLQVTETDPNGVVRKTEYDLKGRVVRQIVDPDKLRLTTSYAYDVAGHVLTVTDSANTVTKYVYNKLGQRAQQFVDPDGLRLVTQYWYDRNGQLTLKFDANGKAWRYAHDANGRLIYEQDPEGGLTGYAYDNEGRVVRQTRYAEKQTTLQMTELGLGQVEVSVTSIARNAANDQVTRYAYDAMGRQTFVVDALGEVVESQYDANGRAVARIEYPMPIVLPGEGSAEAPLSDGQVRALLQLNGNERVTRLVYDQAGRARYEVNAEGGVAETSYDLAGNVTSRIEYAGKIAINDLPWRASAADISSRIVLQAGNDRITRFYYDNAGRERFELDALGYVSETRYLKDRTQSFRYAAAPVLNVATARTGDVATAVASIASVSTEVRRDTAGRVTETVDAMGVLSRDELDAAGRVRRHISAVGLAEQTATTYAYDAAGRVLQKTTAESTAAAATTQYKYDALGNLVAEIEARGYELAYGSSAWANAERTRLGFADDPTKLDAQQRQTLLDRYTTRHTYDGAGHRLTTTNAAGATSTTTYDAFGNAVRVIDPLGNAGFFYFDRLNRLSLQVDPEGYATETIYADCLTDKVKSVRRYFNKVSGAIGTTTRPAVTAHSNDALSTYEYDRLGRVTRSADAAGASETIRYEVNGNRFDKQVTNKLGGMAVYEHDRLGHQVKETLPVTAPNTAPNATQAQLPVVNTYAYDAFGNRTSSVEADGLPERRETTFRYDKAGRITHRIGQSYTAVDGATQATSSVTPVDVTTYDALGRTIATTSRANWSGGTAIGGARTLSYYDAAGNLSARIAPDGAMTSYVYSVSGKVLKETAWAVKVALPAAAGGTPPAATPDSANDRVTTSIYDVVDRLLETTRDTVVYWQKEAAASDASINLTPTGPGTVTLKKQVYDAAGNVVQEIDGRGNSVYNYYDRIGRKVLRIDQEGYATAWDYADLFDSATQEIRYSTRVPKYARQDDLGTAIERRDPAMLRAGLVNGNLRPVEGSNALRLVNLDGSGSTLSRTLGPLVAGDTLTATVWFKADAQTSTMMSLGEPITPGSQPNIINTFGYGDSGWQQLTTSFTIGHDGELVLSLAVDASGPYAQAGHYVLFDRLQVQSTRYGTIVNESFESSVSTWTVKGTAPTLERVAMDPDRVTQMEYDRMGRLGQKRVSPLAFDYVDAAGGVRSSGASAVTNYRYDGLGNLTQQQERVAELADGSNLWNTTDIVYDKLGREVRRQSPGYVDYLGATVRPTVDTEYDGLGNVRRSIQRGTADTVETDDRITRYRYNVNGDRIEATDANNNVTQYDLDAQGRVSRSTQKAVKDANGGTRDIVKLYQYDAAGRNTVQTDVMTGEVRRTGYNAFGEVIARGLGNATQETIVYNTMGLVQRSNSGDGATKYYLYDQNGNTTRQIASPFSDLTGVSLSTAAQDGGLLHTFSLYDKRNQLIKTVEPDISYQRDKASLQQAFTQQLAGLYGPLSVANVSGGTYATAQGEIGSSTQVTNGQASSPEPTVRPATGLLLTGSIQPPSSSTPGTLTETGAIGIDLPAKAFHHSNGTTGLDETFVLPPGLRPARYRFHVAGLNESATELGSGSQVTIPLGTSTLQLAMHWARA